MTDEEYWADVARVAGYSEDPGDYDDDPILDEEIVELTPCNVCGSLVACAFDSEGRPLIHTEPEEDESS